MIIIGGIMNLELEIKNWLLTQADWLQEAAVRILQKSTLSENDYQEISALIKTPEGRLITQHRNYDELIVSQLKSELRLKAIKGVIGIDVVLGF